jgi:hypothetical protein
MWFCFAEMPAKRKTVDWAFRNVALSSVGKYKYGFS